MSEGEAEPGAGEPDSDEVGRGAERRVHTRYPVLWSGDLSVDQRFDWFVLKCKIRNVSISGVHVLVERALAPDTPVTLRIERVGTFTGHVAWSDGARLGVRFDEAPERIGELIREHLG